MTACVLKYLVRGVPAQRETQSDLKEELALALPRAASIVVLPVVDGFSVEIEMVDLHPFSSTSFEPYVAEHILPDAVKVGCRVDNHELHLLKAHFA